MTNWELTLNEEKNALKGKLNQTKNADGTLYMIYNIIQNIADPENSKNLVRESCAWNTGVGYMNRYTQQLFGPTYATVNW